MIPSKMNGGVSEVKLIKSALIVKKLLMGIGAGSGITTRFCKSKSSSSLLFYNSIQIKTIFFCL